MPIDEQRAYDHYRWATRYGKMGMEKKAKAHIERAMHYGAPEPKKRKRMDDREAFRVLGASTTARSTDPYPDRSAKFRYEMLKKEYKDNPAKLDEVQRAYDTLLRYNLVDPVDKKQNSIPKSEISPVDPSAAYNTLGVPQGDFEAAKRAYYKLALQEHPDKGGTVEKMQVLTGAWECIKKAHGVKFGSRSVRTRAV